jgi:hypothetical protein
MVLSWAVAGHANEEAQKSRPAMHVLLGVKAEFPAGTPHNTFPNVVWNEEGRLNPAHGYRWAAEGLYSYDVVRIVSGTSDDTYPNVVRDAEGTVQPAPGYQWIDDNLDNYEVQAIYPGAPHYKYPHVVWDAEGSLNPAPGFEWTSNDPDDFTVIVTGSNNDTGAPPAGTPHHTYPNVVYTADGNLDPAPGYEWASNDPDNFTVIVTGSRAANELVCEGYSANSERAVFVDCSDRRAVIDILAKAWQTLRENQIEGDTEDLCWDPYQSAKELHPSIEVTHIAPNWFLQCNMALQYVQ